MNYTNKLLTTILGITLSTTLSMGCGGCSNNTENNQTTADMSSDDMGGECTPGQAGCVCVAEDSSCEGGAMCVEGICKGVETVSGLTVSSDKARACEFLFEMSEGTTLLGADYDEGIEGALRQRGERSAIAITSMEDAALPSSVLQLKLDGPVSGVKISEARCYDNAGELLSDAEVTLTE